MIKNLCRCKINQKIIMDKKNPYLSWQTAEKCTKMRLDMGFFLGTHTSYLFFPIDYLRCFVPILFKIIEDFFFLVKKTKGINDWSKVRSHMPIPL